MSRSARHRPSEGAPEPRPAEGEPTSRFGAACLDLSWSLWTELGVPGVVRRHQGVVIDPESLLLWTPSVWGPDPRLRDVVLAWATAHGDWCSWTRLQGLRRSFPASIWLVFENAQVPIGPGATKSARDPAAASRSPWPTPRSAPLLPMDRVALLRFRLRALCGVGARADVLCELLAGPQAWASAADLADIGYSKRSIARVLADLSLAAIVNSRARDNTIRFQLQSASALGELVGTTDRFVAWHRLLPIFAKVQDLIERFDGRPEPVRRVEANKVREFVAASCAELRIPAPPPTRGKPDAWDLLLGWAVATTGAIAQGDMPGRHGG